MIYLKRISPIYPLLLLLIVSGCYSSASDFILSDTSRLPSWFENKTNLPRAKLHAKIYFYDPSLSDFGKVNIEILDSGNRKLAEGVGKWRWHPSSQPKIEGVGYIERPLLFIVEINGTTDIYEQWKPDDVLRIVDSPASKNTDS